MCTTSETSHNTTLRISDNILHHVVLTLSHHISGGCTDSLDPLPNAEQVVVCSSHHVFTAAAECYTVHYRLKEVNRGEKVSYRSTGEIVSRY